MAINIRYPMLISLLMVSAARAMEPVPDEELSSSVAQDGITISTSVNWLTTAVKIHDLNGVPVTPVAGYSNAGTLVFNGAGIRGCADAACNPTTNPTFHILIDSVGGAAPVLQVAVNWDPAITKIRLLLDKISLENGLAGNNVEMIDFAQNYVEILRPAGSPSLSIQLGNEPSGNMLTFNSFNVGTLDFGQVLFRDKSDNLANNRNLRFNFGVTGLNLTNTTMNITPTGLVLANASLSGLGFTMTDIIAGNTTTSMGSIGVTNMTLTNFSVRIAGKS